MTSPALRTVITLCIVDPQAHLLEITVEVATTTGAALPSSLTFFMPVWTPGSYLVREYARHIEGMTAQAGAMSLTIRKPRKNAWIVVPNGNSSLTLSYRLYANELTVRTNHVDESHAYWNAAATYVVPEAFVEEFIVQVQMPSTWAIATPLPQTTPEAPFPCFRASSLDELMDSPFECGPMQPHTFDVLGHPHELWVWSNPPTSGIDWPKVITDTRRIIETEAALLTAGSNAELAVPYERYCFLWHVSPRGRGGLEHASSCTLLTSPDLFQTRSGYLTVLSLVAHEFFHLWNVKRIRPAGLSPYRYQEENYTSLLWWFEGGTSYYDWLILRRAGLCTAREYLEHLATEFARLYDTPGALVQSLTDASFDAWIKAYRPDENSLNSTVSYYLKGELVCALIDLEIRNQTKGKKSLDDVLRHLWWNYGQRDVAVPESAMVSIFEAATGTHLAPLFARWIDSTAPLDADPLLATVGLLFTQHAPRGTKSSLGVRIRRTAGRTFIERVYRGGAAARAGFDKDDEIIAIAHKRLDGESLASLLRNVSAGQEIEILACRDGQTFTRLVVLDPPRRTEGSITLQDKINTTQLQQLQAWLGDDALDSLR